jgi:glycosyltransferase involved in cell wall biosynthesis
MRIAYVGPFSLSSSSANVLRVKGVAEALVFGGHHVVLCPGVIIEGVDQSFVDSFPDEIGIHLLNEYKCGFASSLNPGLRGLFLGDVTLRWLEQLQIKPDVIVLYGTHLGYLSRLLWFCKKYKIRLLLDIVEWYDPTHLPGGRFGPFAMSNELSMRWAVELADGAFVISRYLEEYYNSKKMKTLRLPPLLSASPIRPRQFREDNGALNLCYIGSPGKKEEFGILFAGIDAAISLGCKINLHVAGISEREFADSYPDAFSFVSRNRDSFKFYGRVDNKNAKNIIASSDFLLVARRPVRFSNAGFPFKVAESLLLGTPVMANNFSDIFNYVNNGVDSVLIESLTKDAVANSILFGASLTETAIMKLKECARCTADKVFLSVARATEVDQFVRDL